MEEVQGFRNHPGNYFLHCAGAYFDCDAVWRPLINAVVYRPGVDAAEVEKRILFRTICVAGGP